MSTEIDLEHIEDGQMVRAFIPIKNSTERFRSNCTFSHKEDNHFSLHFPDDTLPVERLAVKKSAIITTTFGGVPTSLEAIVNEIVSDTVISLKLATAFSHEQLREFFRVDAVTKVITKEFPSTLSNSEEEGWTLHGETLDISGNGILGVFPSKIPPNKAVNLNIILPNENEDVISLTATEVRSILRDDSKWEVALQFKKIKSEDRDKIIACCLTIQRKMLQLKVRVRS